MAIFPFVTVTNIEATSRLYEARFTGQGTLTSGKRVCINGTLKRRNLVMCRIAIRDIDLDNESIKIQQGPYVMIDYTTTKDPVAFQNPDRFDICRWIRARDDPVFAHKALLVSKFRDEYQAAEGK
ncbi:hypothetical protein COCMIDRAFT_23257 [Bipolaris oryzae ATCC 44560]|uniref:Uncharacterized protein n=1 Tax=Bipolaris oryzae ATCC 44560 TaxID=930090 RepID=W6ZBA6_COCMI|nr:uncharacterized protein COCMIDRAFT_23257 [Bipolaris oryzae ATCC 44560]EUC49082.1 hypothetical protein COCMIDRAFT_23257 [Bipolaris oryzae ATCC 44560]